MNKWEQLWREMAVLDAWYAITGAALRIAHEPDAPHRQISEFLNTTAEVVEP